MPKDNSNGDAPCGAAAFEALCERTGNAVPDTYRSRTASGGQHLYFAAPSGLRLANTAGTVAPLVDTRAWGGYVVAAGSITPAGPYETVSGPVATSLPSWLLSILKPVPGPVQAPSVPVTAQSRRYADTALGNEVRNVSGAQLGQREARLFRAARAMGRFIAWGDLPRHEVEQALQEAGEAVGLPPSQCRATLRSALNWSIAHNQRRRDAA